MKKIKKFGIAFLVFSMILMPVLALGKDCVESVEVICNSYDKICNEIKKAKTLDEFENINFENCLDPEELASIEDECWTYRLTKNDKTRIGESYKAMIDSTIEKIVDMTYGLVSNEDLTISMSPMLQQHNKILENSETFGDYIEGLSTMVEN